MSQSAIQGLGILATATPWCPAMCNCCISPGVVAARRSKVGQPHSHLPHMYRVQARSAHQLRLKQLCLTSLVSPAKSIPIDAEPGFGTFPAIVSVALVMRSAERRCDVGQPHSRLSHMYRVQALSAYTVLEAITPHITSLTGESNPNRS